MPVTNIGDDGPDGMQIGARASTASVPSKAAFFGATPVAQRASAVQATSNISLTTFATINTNQAAFDLEVANTFIALGIWKGGA